MATTTTQCVFENGDPAEEDDAFTLSGSISVAGPRDGAWAASGKLDIDRFGVHFTVSVSFSGSVETGGHLNGTYTENFAGSNGFSSQGSGTFTGSESGNALSIEISGNDTDIFGITCVVMGTFKGYR